MSGPETRLASSAEEPVYWTVAVVTRADSARPPRGDVGIGHTHASRVVFGNRSRQVLSSNPAPRVLSTLLASPSKEEISR